MAPKFVGKSAIAMGIKKKAENKGPQSAYLKRTYEVVRAWTSRTRVEYKPHAKKPGTISFDRYERYSKARTVGEALELGSKVADLLNDYQCKYLRMMDSEQNRRTLRKKGEALGPDANKWDKALNRLQGPKELKMKQKEKRMAHIEKLATGFGIDIQLLKQQRSGSESVEETLQRIVAEATAEKKMNAAEGPEGKKISDADVLEVLRLWGFKRNDSRQNVLPNGKTWIHSDTFGLVNGHDGTYIATASSREYPIVTRLLNRWLKDNLPKDVIPDFPYTSINVNFDYAARRHRDGNNVGPSLIKALGKFEGGNLWYWPEDNKGCHVDVLPDDVKVTYDIRKDFQLFDGNRAHGVEPFKGERFSVVFFSVGMYFKASPEALKVLEDCGFPFPNEETMNKAQNMMPAPNGYPRSSWVVRPSETPAAPTGLSILDQLAGDRAPKTSDKEHKENHTPPQKRKVRESDASSQKARKADEVVKSSNAAATIGEARSDCPPGFKAGDLVHVKDEVRSLNVSEFETNLAVGERGSVIQVDVDGDVQVYFFDHPEALQWVARSDLENLSLLPLPTIVPKREREVEGEAAGQICQASFAAASKSMVALKQMGTLAKAQLKKACARQLGNTEQAVKPKKARAPQTPDVEVLEALGTCAGDGCIEFIPNGKTEATHAKSYQRYEQYAKATTFQEAVDLGCQMSDFVYDFQKGFLKIVTKGNSGGTSRFDEQTRRWRDLAEKIRGQKS